MFAEKKIKNRLKTTFPLQEFQVKLSKMDEIDATLKLSETKVKQLQQTIKDLTNERDGLETKLNVEKDKCAQCIEMLEDERNTVRSKRIWSLFVQVEVYNISRFLGGVKRYCGGSVWRKNIQKFNTNFHN